MATAEASRVLTRFNYDYTVPVDVISFVESDGVVLNFQPLGNLAGAYIPVESKGMLAGILVNEQLPLTKQRFTIAHEYCHHICNHSASVDTETELFVESYKRSQEERLAELFASCLLMPRGLVLRLLRRMNVNQENIEAGDVYSLSLRLGTSYAATVHRLRDLELVGRREHDKLQRTTPIQLKRELGAKGLGSSWNDIWVLGPGDNGSLITMRQGDNVRIHLEETPTTGYKWGLKSSDERIRCVDSTWEANENELIGSPGIREFGFVVEEAGNTLLELMSYREWDLDHVADQFVVTLSIQNKRHGIAEWLLTG
ncbi:ImmA/IrrE family metallo-endopeptidase [Ferroacidibacillus organovorans]|nr:protease inhibitor I42 family protein [Ferroacidibacillus organovorans]